MCGRRSIGPLRLSRRRSQVACRGGVGLVGERGDELGELAVAGHQMGEADGGGHDGHHPSVLKAQAGRVQAVDVGRRVTAWKVTTSGAGWASAA